MNKKRLVFTVLLVVCLLALVSVAASAQSSPNVRWEYTSVAAFFNQIVDRSNTLGAEGWELITIIENKTTYTLIFKRPIK
jgi:hypothetical protein